VNIPVSICQERGIFEKHGLNVAFKAVPEGTGKLLDMIEKGEADIALTVADATISGCAKGRPIQVVGTWVNSPLVWAIAGAKTEANQGLFRNEKLTISDVQRVSSEKGTPLRFGISRPGSGSQTMAQYCCMVNNLPSDNLKFVVANDFKGLRAGSCLLQCSSRLYYVLTVLALAGQVWQLGTSMRSCGRCLQRSLGSTLVNWCTWGRCPRPGRLLCSPRNVASRRQDVRKARRQARTAQRDCFVSRRSGG
jgi:ABC-type nitrate/sulfonate/bicarbonate transport system substrate-binding protein